MLIQKHSAHLPEMQSMPFINKIAFLFTFGKICLLTSGPTHADGSSQLSPSSQPLSNPQLIKKGMTFCLILVSVFQAQLEARHDALEVPANARADYFFDLRNEGENLVATLLALFREEL